MYIDNIWIYIYIYICGISQLSNNSYSNCKILYVSAPKALNTQTAIWTIIINYLSIPIYIYIYIYYESTYTQIPSSNNYSSAYSLGTSKQIEKLFIHVGWRDLQFHCKVLCIFAVAMWVVLPQNHWSDNLIPQNYVGVSHSQTQRSDWSDSVD